MKKISDKDLKSLYNHAIKINKISKKYGLEGITQIYTKAIEQKNSLVSSKFSNLKTPMTYLN